MLLENLCRMGRRKMRQRHSFPVTASNVLRDHWKKPVQCNPSLLGVQQMLDFVDKDACQTRIVLDSEFYSNSLLPALHKIGCQSPPKSSETVHTERLVRMISHSAEKRHIEACSPCPWSLEWHSSANRASCASLAQHGVMRQLVIFWAQNPVANMLTSPDRKTWGTGVGHCDSFKRGPCVVRTEKVLCLREHFAIGKLAPETIQKHEDLLALGILGVTNNHLCNDIPR